MTNRLSHSKKCITCKLIKNLGDFNKNRNQCKLCKNLYNKQYFETHREEMLQYKKEWSIINHEYKINKQREYFAKNKEEVYKKQKEYHEKNREHVRELARKRYAKDPDRTKAVNKKWRDNNPDYFRNKMKNDVIHRIKHNIRSRIRTILKQNTKTGSAIRDLGCTLEELKQHLEKQFKPGMTWENYGRKGWEIDHIVPLSRFNLTNREEFLKAVNYMNLQPLWRSENRKKSDKYV